MDEPHDVIVVGAGPAGAALASLLAAQGLEVLLVDRAAFPRDKTCGDGLTPRALSVLRAMGLLDKVQAIAFRVNRALLVAPDGDAVSVPVSPGGGLPGFGLVLPRYHLDDLLRQHAVAAGAAFRSRVVVTDVLREAGRVVGVRASTPEGPVEFRARLTVLATGAAVALLERAGLLTRPPVFDRAARTYYEGVRGLADAFEFYFDSRLLPGYGWVFPTSPTAANVGAILYARKGRSSSFDSPRQALDGFVTHPRVGGRLQGACAVAPVKGYPLRVDFPTARLAFPGLALVGEACGLVNPLTSEGIDYALESAETAAEVLGPALLRGESAERTAHRHRRALRERFLRGFEFLLRVRNLGLRPRVLNRACDVARHSRDLQYMLVHLALGDQASAWRLLPRSLWSFVRG